MTEMTATQRLMMAGQGKEPDRVPVGGVSINWAWRQVYGSDSFADYASDPERLAKLMVWSCKELGCDSATAMTDDGLETEGIAEASGLSYPSARWSDYPLSEPHRLYAGDPIKEMHYGDPLIKTMKDADKLKPADPYKHGRMPIVLKAIELANKELKGEYPIGGLIGIPIVLGGLLMGFTQMFMAMEKDIELWKKVEDVCIKTSYDFAKAMIKAGAVGLLSHAALPQYVGPKRYFEKPVWVQADHPPELFNRLWDDFKVGVGLHPCTTGPWEQGYPAWKTMLDHTPSFFLSQFGGADALARAKEELAPATVMGNIDPVDIMLHGSPSDVEEACIELIKKCGPGGRYVLAPGCGVSLDTPFENMKALIDSAKKYGKYPIKL